MNIIDNYIYIYNLGSEGEFLILPTYPDSISDSMGSTFQSSTALARSAPVFSYSYSGPRVVQVNLGLHRDMLYDMNYGKSNFKVEIGDDYVDTLIKKLQAIAVPSYRASDKSVKPPMVAIRFGNEVFIKGVVQGGVSISYSKPLLENNRYAQVSVSFTVYEYDPYDADTVAKVGSFRGITNTLSSIYKT